MVVRALQTSKNLSTPEGLGIVERIKSWGRPRLRVLTLTKGDTSIIYLGLDHHVRRGGYDIHFELNLHHHHQHQEDISAPSSDQTTFSATHPQMSTGEETEVLLDLPRLRLLNCQRLVSFPGRQLPLDILAGWQIPHQAGDGQQKGGLRIERLFLLQKWKGMACRSIVAQRSISFFLSLPAFLNVMLSQL